MAIILLVRAVSDRFIEAAKADPDLAFVLLDRGAPPPEWHVNAVRDHARRRDALATAGISFETDVAELHDLGGAWDGLQRTLDMLASDDANLFRAGAEVGDDEESGIRVLTSAETSVAVRAQERIDRASVESAMRKVLEASRGVGAPQRNPFTGEMQTLRARALDGVGGKTDDEVVGAFADAFDLLRNISKDASDRGFGLAVQVVL